MTVSVWMKTVDLCCIIAMYIDCTGTRMNDMVKNVPQDTNMRQHETWEVI